MTFSITQPYYATSDKRVITCLWDNPEFGPIPFSANPDDSTSYGPEIYSNCVAGEYGPVVSYEDSHWYSLIDDNEWNGRTYKLGATMISPTGTQPPNSTNQPIPEPPTNNASIN